MADAVVYDAPILAYYASHKGRGRVKLVGRIFQNENYGFALRTNSPYREAINQAILTLKENGTYQTIYHNWFGEEP